MKIRSSKQSWMAAMLDAVTAMARTLLPVDRVGKATASDPSARSTQKTTIG